MTSPSLNIEYYAGVVPATRLGQISCDALLHDAEDRSMPLARLITARPMTTELGDDETSYRNKQASAARAA